jgi:hypothetical protein
MAPKPIQGEHKKNLQYSLPLTWTEIANTLAYYLQLFIAHKV